MKNLQILCFVLAGALFYSCENEDILDDSKDISIDELKEFYDSNKGSSAGGRSNFEEVVWDLASYRSISIGDVLVMPLEYDERVYAEGGEVSRKHSLKENSFAYGYKDSDGIHFKTVQMMSTRNTAIFTGHLLVSNIDGEIERVVVYERGEFVEERMVDYQDKSAGRTAVQVCTTYTYWWCTEHDESDDCNPVFTVEVCTSPSAELPSLTNELVAPEVSGGGTNPAAPCDEGTIVYEGSCFEELFEDQNFQLCGDAINFSQVANSFSAEISGLGASVWSNAVNAPAVNAEIGIACIEIPDHHISTAYDAGIYFAEIFNFARKELYFLINTEQLTLTNSAVRNKLIEIVKRELDEFFPGSSFSSSSCSGSVASSVADYSC